jgi:hypothetical protein
VKFTVEIELGNAAMSTSDDVARGLREIADRVEGFEVMDLREKMRLRDENGNTVGSFVVSGD